MTTTATSRQAHPVYDGELRFFVSEMEGPIEEGPYIIVRHFRLYRAPIVLVRTPEDYYAALQAALSRSMPDAVGEPIH